jgi:quinol monooxygenase YgiN
MTEKVRVVARVVALANKIEEVKTLVISVVEPTRKEQGCLSYHLLQNELDPRDFTFVEEWQTKEDLERHLASNHIQEAIAQLDGLASAPPDIRYYQLIC